MAKPKRKEKWQGYAKSHKVKFQENDTIIMLVTAVAHKVGVNPDKFKDGKKLEVAVEKAVLDAAKKTAAKKPAEKKPAAKQPAEKKPAAKKPAAKKPAEKKPAEKKPAAKKPAAKKPTAKKEENKLPEFGSIPEMKHFCVINKMHKKEGYVVASKGEMKDFLAWIKANISDTFVSTATKAESTAAPSKKEDAPKKDEAPTEKKEESKAAKKSIEVKTPDNLSDKKSIEIPQFKNPKEMKDFCLTHGLNRIDGYIVASKQKKTVFLEWIIEHKDDAVAPTHDSMTSNPHSPSSGIGELKVGDNVAEAVAAIGKPDPKVDGIDPAKIGEVEKTEADNVNVSLPPLNTGDVQNAPKTAIETNKGAGFQLNKNQPIEEIPYGKGNQEMEDLGNSIIHHLNDSYQARFHGGMLVAEFKQFCTVSLGKYEHAINSDDNGSFLVINDGNGNESRFPKEGYLKVR